MSTSKPAARAGWPSQRDSAREAELRLALSLLDLTTLRHDDTEDRVRALCAKGRMPAGSASAVGDLPPVAAVCVFARFVPTARDALSGSDVRVAAVTGGFPHPRGALSERCRAVTETVAAGADEVDVVITRSFALEGRWDALRAETAALKQSAARARLKAILAAGELGSLDVVRRASEACLAGGADFIKTSTGRERVNATIPIGRTMMQAIRDHEAVTGRRAGFKAAGGIRTAEGARAWVALGRDLLGEDALHPDYFRIGASSLLDDIVAKLSSRPTRPAS